MSAPAEQIVTAGVLGDGRGALTVGVLMAIAMFALEGMGVVPAMPTAVRELGGLSLYGWTFSGFMLAWLLGSVAGGLLADARGPRLPMALGLGGFGAGLGVAALAHGMAQFLAGRVLQGAGGGFMLASAYVAISRGYPDALRARVMALSSSVWVLPAVVGPAISGKVTEWLGWRWLFAGVVPFIAVTAIVVLPQLARFELALPIPRPTRVIAALRLAVGAALLILAPDLRDRGLIVAVVIAALGLALAAPAFRALLPPGTLVARVGLPAGLAARGLVAFSFFGAEAFVPLAATRLRGASPTAAGLALSAGAIGWVGASWVQERIEARVGAAGRARRVQLGFVVLSVGLVLVAAALLGVLPFWAVHLGWAIAGAGIGLSFSTGGLVCIAAAPPGEEGRVSGQLQLAEALSTATGAGLGGVLLAGFARAGLSLHAGHAAVFAMALVAALLGVVISSRVRPAP